MSLYINKNEDQIKIDGAGLMFYIPVNSYGHVETASSPIITLFSWACLTKQNLQYLVHILSLSFLNQGKEENDRRNYFMIKLHKSIGPG